MKIISRGEAQRNGLKRFYTSEPCIQGHIAERYTSSNACCKCLFIITRDRRRKRSSGFKATRLRAIEYKGGKCEDCGWKGHHSGFEFDHPDGRINKKGTAAYVREGMGLIFRSYAWSRIEKELKKVNLVCSTCHNIRAWTRNQGIDK